MDPAQSLTDITPWSGFARPGKCLLSPDMVMLECQEGVEEDDWAFDRIREEEGL